MFDFLKRGRECECSEPKDDTCTGHHFKEVGDRKVEIKEPNGFLSVVVAKVNYRCQHTGCLESKSEWKFDRFISYRKLTGDGGLYMTSRIRETVERLTDGEVSSRYIQTLLMRYSRFGDVAMEVRGQDGD